MAQLLVLLTAVALDLTKEPKSEVLLVSALELARVAKRAPLSEPPTASELDRKSQMVARALEADLAPMLARTLAPPLAQRKGQSTALLLESLMERALEPGMALTWAQASGPP
mmetsp:Transcript_82788/g.230866  ORF Transcript_82788/g.230866 Transcript_82788/m.230866 type:complete len:112 (+) Transcript_82788:123-458(+)